MDEYRNLQVGDEEIGTVEHYDWREVLRHAPEEIGMMVIAMIVFAVMFSLLWIITPA